MTLALNELRMQSALYCTAELSAPWGFAVQYDRGAMFYIVTRGCCLLEIEGLAAQRLTTGDFVVLPHCDPHMLRDAPGTPVAPLEPLLRGHAPGANTPLRFGGGGAITQLLGGCFWFEEAITSTLLRSLPPLLFVASEQGHAVDWLQTTVSLVGEEARCGRPGGQAVISRLSDVLFIQAIRAYADQLPDQAGNWLCALRDAQIGQALALMHSQPERGWTVETLAVEVAMSRSAFAARFTHLVGEPPLRYLTRRRMQVAARLLITDHQTLAEVAAMVGYQSEMAFSKAFKQWMGVAPGCYRRMPATAGSNDPAFRKSTDRLY